MTIRIPTIRPAPIPTGGAPRRATLLGAALLLPLRAHQRRAALVAAALLVSSAGLGCGEQAPSTGSGMAASSTNRPQVSAEPPVRSASPAELAIVAPAAPGGKLADWSIRAIHAVDHGTLDVVCEKDGARVVLSVALAADGGPEPPVSTDRYAVFYSSRGAAAEEGERLAKALAELLHENRAAPPPPGLAPFVPRTRTL